MTSTLLRAVRAVPLLVLGVLFIYSGHTWAFASKPPVLMALGYTANNTEKRVNVDIVPGEYASPVAGKPQGRWAILTGQGIRTTQQPPDRQVELYQGKGNARKLICVIAARYYAESAGIWVPSYRLVEEELAVPMNGKLVPLSLPQGDAALMILAPTSAPNGEGYYPSFEFSLSTGPVQIDSWVVK